MRFEGEGVAETSGVVFSMMPKNSRDVVGVSKPTDLECFSVTPSSEARASMWRWVVCI